MSVRPFILVTNDDGIDADGLWALAEALLAVGDVMVAAPAFQQSGTGTAFTLHRELQSEPARSRLEGVDAWQVDGTPSDAVIVALRRHAKRHVDMVVSGINPGPNLGGDVLHSGTVAAALQGYYRGLPAMAISIASARPVHLRTAGVAGARIARLLAAVRPPLFLNVNVPDLPLERLGESAVVALSPPGHTRLVQETTAEGMIRSRLEYRADFAPLPDTDVWAVAQGRVAVTPLQINLTAHEHMEQTRVLLQE